VVIFITLLAGFVPLLQVTFFALLEDFYPGRLGYVQHYPVAGRHGSSSLAREIGAPVVPGGGAASATAHEVAAGLPWLVLPNLPPHRPGR
jgi:hypothetical protein